jgi:hypothetical protein
VIAAATTLTGLATDRFDPSHPMPSQLAYVLDADTGKAWWASTESHPGPETARYVHGQSTLPGDYPYLGGQQLSTGPAQVAQLPAPQLTRVVDRPTGGRREITVRVTPQRPVRLVAVELAMPKGSVIRAQVQGQDVSTTALGRNRLMVVFHGPPAGGVEATFTVTAPGPVDVRAIDGSDGLAGLPGYRPRPADVQAAGSHSSDLVLVAHTTRIG